MNLKSLPALLLMLSLCPHQALAGSEPAATPYRPTVSNPADLSAPGWLEMEAGVARSKGGGNAWQNDTPWLAKLAFSEDFGVLIGDDAWTRQTDASGATLANCGDTGIVIGDMNTFPSRIKPEIQRALGNVDTNESFFLNRVHMHTHPCKNAGLLAQATVRVMNEKRHNALRSFTGLVPQEKTSCRAETKNRAVDLRTIRLRRTGALAVDNNEPVIHRAPLCPQAPQPVTIFLYL